MSEVNITHSNNQSSNETESQQDTQQVEQLEVEVEQVEVEQLSPTVTKDTMPEIAQNGALALEVNNDSPNETVAPRFPKKNKPEVITDRKKDLRIIEEGIARTKNKSFTFKDLHLPELHLSRRFNRARGHGQLVEEPCSPVNTLERQQVELKESLDQFASIQHRPTARERWRDFATRARKRMTYLTACSCINQRGQRDVSIKYNKEDTTVELPPDITAVSNENAEDIEMEVRTDNPPVMAVC